MMITKPSSILPVSILFIVIVYLIFRSTSLRILLGRWWRIIEDHIHVYQFYKVPEYNESYQENQLYQKVSTYLSSLSSIEDSDFANLFSGKKSNEISVQLDSNQIVHDSFLGARVSWKNEQKQTCSDCRTFVLKIKKKDKRRILRPYLQHIHIISDEIEIRRKDIKLYTNTTNTEEEKRNHYKGGGIGCWRSIPFTHPSNLETIAMDVDLKNKLKSDLESFLKSKQYYHRLGRVWKRSYLLYGPSGTGKSSFIAAMAKFLCYDIYDVDLSKVKDNSDLKLLLLQTNSRSVVVVEDLDKFLNDKSTSSAVSLSGVLNFMDGIFSCCGEERIMVFTMNNKDQIDSSILRPGRIDAQIYFPLCDFVAFKTLANSYLGLKDHKLFPQVEEIFQNGATLSPAEIGEIMIVNRSSPSRALKTVITALQTEGRATGGKLGRKVSDEHRSGDESVENSGVLCTESVHTVREFRKLYGLLRMKSSRKTTATSGFDVSSVEKDS